MKNVLLTALLVVAAMAAPQESPYPDDAHWANVQQPEPRIDHLAPAVPVHQPAAPIVPVAPVAPEAPEAPVVPIVPELPVDAPSGPHGVPVILPEGVTFGPNGPSEEDEERFGFWGPMMGWGWGWGRR